MKQGKIVKGIAGFYYVSVAGSGIYECKAKGAFRQKKMKPLVGDNVSIDIIDEEEKKGNVVEILPRKNALVRPAVANVEKIWLRRQKFRNCGMLMEPADIHCFLSVPDSRRALNRCGQHWKEKQPLWQDLPVWENLR